jgi:predicted acyl esterase
LPITNPKAVDESTDTYDTVAWLLKNVPNNNGRVGVVGTSYPGFLAMMAGIDPHPAVKAISPQAPMIDVWMGDDFFHNGAFRQTYGYDYVLGLESSKEDPPKSTTARTRTASPATASTTSSSAAPLPKT